MKRFQEMVMIGIIAICAVLTLGCNNSTLPDDNYESGYSRNIFIAGQEYYKNATNQTYHQAKYWKYEDDSIVNGESTVLSNGPTWGHNYSIQKYNGNVYSAGYVQGVTTGYDTKKLWVNDSVYSIGDDTKVGSVEDLTVDNGTIYLCGWEEADNPIEFYDAKLWIVSENWDVESITISTSPNIAQYEAYAYSICSDDENIYIAGYAGLSSSNVNAILWTVNKATKLITSTQIDTGYSSSRAASICLYKNNLYISGSVRNSGVYNAIYWSTINGNKTVFNRGALSNSTSYEYTKSIFVVNDNVYISGFEYTSGKLVFKYWKNGSVNYITTDPISSLMGKMFVTKDEDIYIVGSIKDSTYYNAYCWINGSKKAMSDGTHDVYVSDIYVDNI